MDDVDEMDGFPAAFVDRANADGVMPFVDFMDLALYGPDVGYYRRPELRVGRRKDADFRTASSSGAIFGECVAAAAAALLGGVDPGAFAFVEIGAEPGQGILDDVSHPFGRTRTIRLGTSVALEGPCIVFSNELFDAQPVNRYVHRNGEWRELGVRLRDGRLEEVDLPGAPEKAGFLPPTAPDGYRLDAPLRSVSLLEQIVRQPWRGLFLAFDYGKSWDELAHACPQGTARAYWRHRQVADLLARPGRQDLTCHVCWDWLRDGLEKEGFDRIEVESQEAFFIKKAEGFVAAVVGEAGAGLSPRRQALLELIHPALMGGKFQVLHGIRM